MIAVNNGHHQYLFEDFDSKQHKQNIQFIEKDTFDGVIRTVTDGTTNEEVLKVLIHRLNFLNKKVPSRESSLTITKLEEALMWLEHRTANRIERGVEGTFKP